MIPIAFYGFLAFLLSLWILPFNNFIGYDGVYYARMAENLMAGRGLTANFESPFTHPPLYPILMGLLSPFLQKDFELSGHLISILAFALTVIPLFHLARSTYSGMTAHWVSFLYATNGFLLIHSNLVMTEPLFTLLVLIQLCLIHLIVQDEDDDIGRGFLCGMVGGLAYWTRPEGLFFYTTGLLCILIFSSRQLALKKFALTGSLVAFLFFFLPYAGFIYSNTHKIPISGAMTELLIIRQMAVATPAEKYLEAKKVYEGLTSDKTRLKMEELHEKFNLLDYLRADHFALLKSGVTSIPSRLAGLTNYFFLGFGFFFVGASWLSAPWDARRKKSEFTLLLFFLTFLPLLWGVFFPKRYLVYFPILLMWMGHGIEVLRNWARESFKLTRKGSLGVAVGACLFFALPAPWYLHRTFTQFPMPFENKEMGLWMRKNIPQIEEEKVAAQHRSVNYYAGAKILRLPYVERFEDFLTYTAHQGAKYFVVGDDLDPPVLDSYRFLLEETSPLFPGILRRHIVRGNHKLILYEIVH